MGGGDRRKGRKGESKKEQKKRGVGERTGDEGRKGRRGEKGKGGGERVKTGEEITRKIENK